MLLMVKYLNLIGLLYSNSCPSPQFDHKMSIYGIVGNYVVDFNKPIHKMWWKEMGDFMKKKSFV